MSEVTDSQASGPDPIIFTDAAARKVGDLVVFMDEGKIVERNNPTDFFDNPQSDRTKLFLSQILSH